MITTAEIRSEIKKVWFFKPLLRIILFLSKIPIIKVSTVVGSKKSKTTKYCIADLIDLPSKETDPEDLLP